MKTKKFDGSDVRRILAGMITDRTVLARIATQWPAEGLFGPSWANLTGGMAVRYFREYGQPPKTQMVPLFEEWAKSTVASEEIVTTVERFLRGVSDENHEDTSEYILDLAGVYFNRIRIEQSITAAKQELENERVDEAEAVLNKRRRVNLGVNSFIEPAKDVEAWLRAFDTDHTRGMVHYRGPLQEFFGDAFQKGRLFAFMAPDKTGKTTWLIDFLYRAVRARCKVAFFDTGDGVEEEFLQRLAVRVSGRPLFPEKCMMPTDWEGDECQFYEEDLEQVNCIEAYRGLQRITRSQECIKSSFHPSTSISAEEIDGMLENWSTELDWRPDVVCIDYADILAPPKHVKDSLDQIDETWKCLRRMSQQRHCLVMTATQVSASYYGKEDGLLKKEHFQGRKTKFAHVNGIIGLNVNGKEKECGMARINKLAWRHGKNNESHYVRVAGCMSIGNPAILSKR